ncbi:hypothetical protein, partial [Streptomyces sp. IBSBF 2390]|uniref:hypothetical protein n=1 Tax=Streptomyces sp. IBSBF 2390 TaxID=2903533 RepID=UPI002FDBE681
MGSNLTGICGLKTDKKEDRIRTLRAYIVTRGPDNLTFSQAYRKLTKAKAAVQRLSSQVNLGDEGKSTPNFLYGTVEDKELESIKSFVNKQKLARDTLKEMGVVLTSP